MYISKIKYYGLSDIGLREKNQDVWVSLPEHNFFALADGMGGHNGGEVAAKKTVSTLSDYIKEKIFPFRGKYSIKKTIFSLTQGIHETNYHIYQLGNDHPDLKGMGSTLCCMYFQGTKAIYAHVGDSRIYLFRNEMLIKLTDDHSLVQRNEEKQILIDKRKTIKNYKNIITRAMGAQDIVIPEVSYTSIQKNDIFFLCSDGLTDCVSTQSLLQIMKTNPNLQLAAKEMIQSAKSFGSKDNITILLIQPYGPLDLPR